MHGKVHISERAWWGWQLRIPASIFHPIGRIITPKSAPQHVPTISGKHDATNYMLEPSYLDIKRTWS